MAKRMVSNVFQLFACDVYVYSFSLKTFWTCRFISSAILINYSVRHQYLHNIDCYMRGLHILYNGRWIKVFSHIIIGIVLNFIDNFLQYNFQSSCLDRCHSILYDVGGCAVHYFCGKQLRGRIRWCLACSGSRWTNYFFRVSCSHHPLFITLIEITFWFSVLIQAPLNVYRFGV